MQAFLTPILVAAIVIGVSTLAVARWSDDLVDRTLLGHAESSAITWRSKLVTSVPAFERLFETGAVTPSQEELIAASMAGSDIFRFEAFAADGTLTFLSDQALFEVEAGDSFNETAAEVGQSGEMIVTIEDGRASPDRPDHYVEAYIPIPNADGRVLGTIEVYVDVSGLAAALTTKFNRLSLALIAVTAVIYLVPTLILIRRTAQLRERDRALLQLSRRDPLTGLLNRGAFNDAIEELFGDPGAPRDAIGIVFVDLDKFKDINDEYGHEFGDQLLKHVADLLGRGSRKDDLLARLGGDEFVVLCPGIDRDALAGMGQRILALVRDTPFVFDDTRLHASLSVGTHLSEPGETERRALHCADLALYQSKANGRGQVTAYSHEVELRDLRRRKVANDVRTALGDDRFFLEFQPIFDMSRRLAGFEALLRLRSVEGEPISPAEFVPIAEDAGLIDEIGTWVLHAAIRAAASWPDETFITINISALQFRSGTLVRDLSQAAEAAEVPFSRICLELTERVLVDDHDSVSEQLADIRALGAQIAIDDFGTGYSSLSYLWHYAFNKLKIDRSFLEAHAFDGQRYARIIGTIIDLGHQLDMAVVMEGVETQDQLDFLRTTSCDLAQGFHLGRPMPIDAATALATTTAIAPRRTGREDRSADA